MSVKAGLGSPSELTTHERVRREVLDDLARDRGRELPVWLTSPLDRALALRLVADDDLPRDYDDLKAYVLLHEPIWAALQLAVSLEMVTLRDARMLSPGSRVLVAYQMYANGADLAGRVQELCDDLKPDTDDGP